LGPQFGSFYLPAPSSKPFCVLPKQKQPSTP